MNPLAKIARGMCLDYLRRKGIDPQDSEDSGEADDALSQTKNRLHRFVDDLSYEDVRRAGESGVTKRRAAAGSAGRQQVAAGSTDMVSKVQGEEREEREEGEEGQDGQEAEEGKEGEEQLSVQGIPSKADGTISHQ